MSEAISHAGQEPFFDKTREAINSAHPKAMRLCSERTPVKSQTLNFALFHEDRQTFPSKTVHQFPGVKRLWHHNSALRDLSGNKQPGCDSGWNSCLDQGERIPVAFVCITMAVHRINKVFHAPAVLRATNLGAHARIAVHRRAKLRRLRKVGACHTQRRHLHSIDLHLFPCVEIEKLQGLRDVDHLIGKTILEN